MLLSPRAVAAAAAAVVVAVAAVGAVAVSVAAAAAVEDVARTQAHDALDGQRVVVA